LEQPNIGAIISSNPVRIGDTVYAQSFKDQAYSFDVSTKKWQEYRSMHVGEDRFGNRGFLIKEFIGKSYVPNYY